MENYPPPPLPPEEGDPMVAEEDSVLRFWDSPPRDIHELLLPLHAAGSEGLQPSVGNPPPDQNVGPVAYSGGDGACNIDGGGGGPPTQPSAPGAASEGVGGDPNAAAPPKHPGWVPFSGPDCSTTCGVLREILHGSDACRAKLSIHGRLGVLSHAVLALQRLQNQTAEERFIMEYVLVESLSISSPFLTPADGVLDNYACGRRQEGQRLIRDTYHELYDALSVDMNTSDSSLPGGTGEPPLQSSAAQSRRITDRGESSSAQNNRKSDKGKRGRGPNAGGGPPPDSGPR